jgi:hypothetical protein
MKRILYLMVDRSGDVLRFSCDAMRNEDDSTNLESYRPENLQGNARDQFKKAVANGYNLSNWHVIETKP